MCCGDHGGDAASVYLVSLTAAARKDISVFADFTLSIETPAQLVSMRADPVCCGHEQHDVLANTRMYLQPQP